MNSIDSISGRIEHAEIIDSTVSHARKWMSTGSPVFGCAVMVPP